MGLLNPMTGAGAPAPEQSPESDTAAYENMGDKGTVAKMVQMIYGEHFDAFKKILLSSDDKTIKMQLPMAINMVLKKIETEAGEPLDADKAISSIFRVIGLLLEDIVKTIKKEPLEMTMVQDIAKNAIALYLKSHNDVLPPELKKQFGKLGDLAKKARGSEAARAAFGEGEQPAEGPPPQQAQPQQTQQAQPQPQQTQQAQPQQEETMV